MNDERRDRYAEIFQNMIEGTAGIAQPFRLADAAMAVADEETGGLRAKVAGFRTLFRSARDRGAELEAENARLRADIADINADSRDVVSRLRAELETLRAAYEIQQHDTWVRQVHIERVRVVLDEMEDGSLYPTGKTWAADIRAALEGDA